MKYEERVIQASFLAGLSDICLGLVLYLTGWGDWYYEKFHVFGVLGAGFLLYAYWHQALLIRDKNEKLQRKIRKVR